MTGATTRRVTPHGGLSGVVVETGGEMVRAFIGGEGRPILLLHGLSSTAAVWADVALRLLGLGCTVVALELPGHGGSGRPPRGASIAWFADTVAAAMRALGAAPATVVGHSLGGQISLRLVDRHPGLVRGLVLVSPSGMPYSRRTRMLAALAAIPVPQHAATLGARLVGRRRFRRLVFEPFLVEDADVASLPVLRALAAGVAENTDARAAGRAAAADTHGSFNPLPCPGVVLLGADDNVQPFDDGLALARAIRAPVRVVARCGHLLPAERPSAIVDAVAALERR
jgi:pimeloyl-ACP methyl ester carboxylesterase